MISRTKKAFKNFCGFSKNSFFIFKKNSKIVLLFQNKNCVKTLQKIIKIVINIVVFKAKIFSFFIINYSIIYQNHLIVFMKSFQNFFLIP